MSLSAAAARRKQAAPAAPADPAVALLAWYDRHRRDLPWRAGPHQASDPYRVWLSEIMLQQTTVKAVGPCFVKFVARWPDVEALADAALDDVLRAWAGLGYYSRARNLHACAVAVARDHNGAFPDSAEALQRLPGIGPYTAAAIAAIAFGRPVMPVDGNIERVTARLFAVAEMLPRAKARIGELARALLAPGRAGDSAQALMDLGATICTPKKPACVLCPLSEGCVARTQGDQESYPRKARKKTGALRRGVAFVVVRGEEVLLRTRPEKGLLGGMTEVPTSDWAADFDEAAAQAAAPRLAPAARWQRKAGVVSHVFTHFPLELVVHVARVPPRTLAPAGMRFTPIAGLDGEALPNLMRKVLAHGLDGAATLSAGGKARKTGRPSG
jgi:A/G-specific adenine glycosylase